MRTKLLIGGMLSIFLASEPAAALVVTERFDFSGEARGDPFGCVYTGGEFDVESLFGQFRRVDRVTISESVEFSVVGTIYVSEEFDGEAAAAGGEVCYNSSLGFSRLDGLEFFEVESGLEAEYPYEIFPRNIDQVVALTGEDLAGFVRFPVLYWEAGLEELNLDCDFCFNYGFDATLLFDGRFDVVIEGVPAPAGLPVLAAGAGLLGFAARCRHRKAPPVGPNT